MTLNLLKQIIQEKIKSHTTILGNDYANQICLVLKDILNEYEERKSPPEICYEGVEGCCIASQHHHTGETFSLKDGHLIRENEK